jgi:hypothetical protein
VISHILGLIVEVHPCLRVGFTLKEDGGDNKIKQITAGGKGMSSARRCSSCSLHSSRWGFACIECTAAALDMLQRCKLLLQSVVRLYNFRVLHKGV